MAKPIDVNREGFIVVEDQGTWNSKELGYFDRRVLMIYKPTRPQNVRQTDIV
jgi:hypothetical protein